MQLVGNAIFLNHKDQHGAAVSSRHHEEELWVGCHGRGKGGTQGPKGPPKVPHVSWLIPAGLWVAEGAEEEPPESP